MMSDRRVPVTMRALIQRINRKYQADSRDNGAPAMELKKTRGHGENLGPFFVLDLSLNRIAIENADPEKIGRELKVLAEYESISGSNWSKPPL